MDPLQDRELTQQTNMSSTITGDSLLMTSWHIGVVLAAFVPLSLCIVVGNFLVIATVWRENHLHTPTNFILASLGVADFITGVLTIPCEVYTDTQAYHMRCDVVTSILAASFFMSGVSLMHQIIVTMDRFLAVSRPLRYPEFVTKRRVVMILASVWLGGSFPACGFIVVWMVTYKETDQMLEGKCGGGAFYSAPRIQKFDLTLAVLVVFGLALLTVFNLYIWRVANDQANQIEGQMRAMNADQKRKRIVNVQATKTVLGIVATFIVSWTPSAIYFLFSSRKHFEKLKYNEVLIITQVCFFFICLNSAVNPLIYGWKNKEFRKGLFKLLREFKLPFSRVQPLQKQQKATVNTIMANEVSMIVS